MKTPGQLEIEIDNENMLRLEQDYKKEMAEYKQESEHLAKRLSGLNQRMNSLRKEWDTQTYAGIEHR